MKIVEVFCPFPVNVAGWLNIFSFGKQKKINRNDRSVESCVDHLFLIVISIRSFKSVDFSPSHFFLFNAYSFDFWLVLFSASFLRCCGW